MNTLNKKQGEGAPLTVTPKTDPTPAWENPLIPNKRLRELYTAMVELRLLEEHIASHQTRKKNVAQLRLHRGEEGILVSTVLSLNPGDLTSESAPSIAIEFLRGTKLPSLLSRTATPSKRPSSELPPISNASVRLNLAIGSALALTALKKGSLTVAYIHASDLTLQEWKPILKLAAMQSTPILFVALPNPTKTDKPGQLSHTASACGTPGIPVDAADPVALYRVTQESMLRIRASGGPVLMECIPFQLLGKKTEPADPILTMQQFMLPRGVATEAWFTEVTTRFAARLRAAAK